MDDLESDLRAMLARHAATVYDDQASWAPPAATPPPRRRWPTWLAAAAAVLVVAGLVTLGAQLGHSGNSSSGGNEAGPAQHATAPSPTAPAGTKLISTLGLEFFVPVAWTVDTPCSSNLVTPLADVRAGPAACGTGSAVPSMRIAAAASAAASCTSPAAVIAGSPVCSVIDNHQRVYRWQHDGAIRVQVETTDIPLATVKQILGTVRSVTTDAVGCPSTGAPAATAPVLPPGPVRLTACGYGSPRYTDYDTVLLGSAEPSSAVIDDVVAGLNMAARHETPTSGRTVGAPADPSAELDLSVVTVSAHYADGSASTVRLVPATAGWTRYGRISADGELTGSLLQMLLPAP